MNKIKLKEFIANTIRECLKEGEINDSLLENIDVDILIKELHKKPFVEFLYVAEFPDITIINVPYFFSKTNHHINIETHMLQDKLLKYMNKYFNKYDIKVFESQKEEQRLYSIIAQPINYNLTDFNK